MGRKGEDLSSFQTTGSSSDDALLIDKGSFAGYDERAKPSSSGGIRNFFLFKYFQGGSIPQAILSLVAATVGTGILLVSNAMAPSGIIWGSIQMAFCAWMSAYTLITLTECANDLGAKSYQEVAKMVFGQKFRHVVNFCCFFANWGSAILFLQLSVQLFAVVADAFGGDSLPYWLTDPDSKILTVLQATLFVLPLSVPAELKALNYFTFVNLCLIILFCYAVIYEGFDYEPIRKSFSTVTMFSLAGFSTTFPSAVFMMTSHTNVIDIFIELKNPTIKKMKTVVYWTITFAFFVCLVVGIVGYATFSSNINILSDQNYANGLIVVAYGYTLDGLAQSYPVMIIINMITMCASIIISQPFNIKPARDCLRDSWIEVLRKFGKRTLDASEAEESNWDRFIYASVTLYTCVLVVLFSDSAQMVMNIVGGGFFSMLCFVFPCLFYLKIRKDDIPRSEKILKWFLVVINTIFAVYSTVENIIEAI